MELAARHRNYKVANILKWRCAEENAVWSWWMVRLYPCEAVTCVLMVSQTQLACDELQTTMIAETNCKRWRLEHDCCTAEKPLPSMLLQVGLQTPCYTNVRIGLCLPPIPQQGCPGTTTLHLMNLPTHILDHSHPSKLSSPHHSPHPNGVTSPHNPFFPSPQAQELSRPDHYRPHRCGGSIAAPMAATAASPPPSQRQQHRHPHGSSNSIATPMAASPPPSSPQLWRHCCCPHGCGSGTITTPHGRSSIIVIAVHQLFSFFSY